jgi:Domain of unknown function (DUF4145)
MEDSYSSDAMIDYFEDNDARESIYYPRRSALDRPLRHFTRLPPVLGRIYQQVVISYDHDLEILCAAGLRALVEGVCDDKGIGGNNLNAKIDGMKSILPENIAGSLHFFRYIGNDALHKLKAPLRSELAQGIDVIEGILDFLYELEHKARRLGKSQQFGW